MRWRALLFRLAIFIICHKPARSDSTCALRVVGKRADINCEGGSLLVGTDPGILDSYNWKLTGKGVQWDNPACAAKGCVLTICAMTRAEVRGAVIRGVRLKQEEDQSVLCVGGKSNIVFDQVEFSDNIAGKSVLHVFDNANVSIKNANVAKNRVGGTVLVAGGQSEMNIIDSTFSDNVAENITAAVSRGGSVGVSKGSCVYAGDQSTVSLGSCSFSGNLVTLQGYGGAISASDNSTMAIVSCQFSNNCAAGGAGGHAYIGGSANVVVSYSNFTDCCKNLTACIGLQNRGCKDAAKTMEDGELVNDGGALAVKWEANVSISHSRFTGNTAKWGGGIALYQDLPSELGNVPFDLSSLPPTNSPLGRVTRPFPQEGSTVTSLASPNLPAVGGLGPFPPLPSAGFGPLSPLPAGGLGQFPPLPTGGLVPLPPLGTDDLGALPPLPAEDLAGLPPFPEGLGPLPPLPANLSPLPAATAAAAAAAPGPAVVPAMPTLTPGRKPLQLPQRGFDSAGAPKPAIRQMPAWAMRHVTGTPKLLIQHCTIANNKAIGGQGGGGLYMDFGTLDVTHSNFTSNSAEEARGGGGLYVKGVPAARFDRVQVTDNDAITGDGGGLKFENVTAVIIDSNITGNSAMNASGGGILVSNSVLTLDRCEIRNNSARQGGSDIDAASDVELVLIDSSITTCSKGLFWMTRNCTVGQLFESGFCRCCPVNTYTLATADYKTSECQSCPSHASCPGGNAIVPNAGYWHSSNFSSQVHACPRGESSCLDRGVCATGYTGNLCGSCTPNYGVLTPFRCGECLYKGVVLAVYLSTAGVLLLVIMLLLHTTLKDNVQGVSSARPSDYLKILVRHLQYLFIVASLRVQWPGPLAAVFTAVGGIFAVASSQVVSVDCLMSSAQQDLISRKRLLTHLLVPLVMFVLVQLLGMLYQVLGSRWCWKEDGPGESSARSSRFISLQYVLPVACLVTLFFFYPFLVRVSLSMFACYPIDDAQAPSNTFPQYAIANATYGYWVSDIQQPCWQGWHKVWALAVGVPCVVLFCLVVPVATFWVLFSNRGRLQDPQFKGYVGFLYHNYRPKRFYWEVVSTVQVAVLVGIAVFSFTLGAYYSAILLNASFALFWALQHMFKPFAFKELHITSLLSISCLYFTTLIALTMITGGSVTPPDWYSTGVAVVGMLTNLAFVLWCCYCIAARSQGVVSGCIEQVRQVVKPRRSDDYRAA